jgi:hypothetical protein
MFSRANCLKKSFFDWLWNRETDWDDDNKDDHEFDDDEDCFDECS